jgi:hypothetical protein
VVAAEIDGGPALTWRVDGFDQLAEVDNWRAILIRD